MPLPTEKTITASKDLRDYVSMYYGPPGVGKSTFVNGLGNRVLMVSTDRGTRTFPALRRECLSWADFAKLQEELTAPKAEKYDFVAIDHVDDMFKMAEDHVMDHFEISSLSEEAFGKGWKMYKDLTGSFIRNIMALRTGVIFVCHEQIKTVKSRAIELERTIPLLGKPAWNLLVPMADLIGYCGFRTIREAGSKPYEIRTIETDPKENLYAKDRTSRARSPLGYDLLDPKVFLETFTHIMEPTNGTNEERQGSQQAAGRRRRARA